MRSVTTITISVALGALALSGCQGDRLSTEPSLTPVTSEGAAEQWAVSGGLTVTLPLWHDRGWVTGGDVEVEKGFGSPLLFWGDIVAEGTYTSNLAYKHQYGEDGTETFTGGAAGKVTLTVSEFLGEPVSGTLDGSLHYHVNRSWVSDTKLLLHGTGDLDGYTVQLMSPADPAWVFPTSYTGTVFVHGTD